MSEACSWAELARPVIAKVLADVGRDDERALRRALRDAYPFGERRFWPYKAWLAEVQRQVGKRSRGPDLFA